MDARGIKPETLVEAAHRGSLAELTRWTGQAEKIIVF
jgi:sulfur relay (sulfurtransferase) complex TusBCD TusD component (DsrE family)